MFVRKIRAYNVDEIDYRSLREASCKAEQKFQALYVEMSMKKEVYDNLVLFREKFGLDNLDPEIKRFVEKTLVDGKRSGL
jgi:hypothetical protein